MAGPERSRRSSRARKGPRDSDSELDDRDLMDTQGTEIVGVSRESDRLAKIQEKNRKAQQKFRERRKEKMLSMEKTIASLEQHVLQLRTEKEHVQEQLAIEKRITAERTVAREPASTSLASDGLQDFDPIDMSFLPMWQGLQLSNEKIRAMPMDTLKMLIQTILQDLRNRLANLATETAPGAAAALGGAVSSAFAFLNRCYLVEPIRYRRVVVDILGASASATGSSGPHDDDPANLALSREQELAISSAVGAFDKAMLAIGQARADAADAVKAGQGRRGSELENMRSFLQVHAHVEALQESLKRENEALVAFLSDVGRVLGHMQLTQAMFATSNHDIFTYCQSIHCRMLMLNNGSGGRASGAAAPQTSGGAGPSGGFGGNGPSSMLPSGPRSGSWGGYGGESRGGSRGDLAGSAMLGGSIPLQDNYLLRGMGDSQGFEHNMGGSQQLPGGAAGALAHSAPGSAGAAGPGSGQKRAVSPKSAFDSPFIYGPGGGETAGNSGATPFRGPSVEAAAAGAAPAFRPAKAGKTSAAPEPGVGCVAAPHDRHDSFLELFRSIGDATARPSDARLPAGLRSLLRDAQGGATDLPGPGISPRNPAELLGTLHQMSSPAVKGLMTLLQQQQSPGRAGGAPVPQASPPAGDAGAGTGTSAGNPSSAIITELETLLNSKEGSRTLEFLAQDLSGSRTFSAADLMNMHGDDTPGRTPRTDMPGAMRLPPPQALNAQPGVSQPMAPPLAASQQQQQQQEQQQASAQQHVRQQQSKQATPQQLQQPGVKAEEGSGAVRPPVISGMANPPRHSRSDTSAPVTSGQQP